MKPEDDTGAQPDTVAVLQRRALHALVLDAAAGALQARPARGRPERRNAQARRACCSRGGPLGLERPALRARAVAKAVVDVDQRLVERVRRPITAIVGAKRPGASLMQVCGE